MVRASCLTVDFILYQLNRFARKTDSLLEKALLKHDVPNSTNELRQTQDTLSECSRSQIRDFVANILESNIHGTGVVEFQGFSFDHKTTAIGCKCTNKFEIFSVVYCFVLKILKNTEKSVRRNTDDTEMRHFCSIESLNSQPLAFEIPSTSDPGQNEASVKQKIETILQSVQRNELTSASFRDLYFPDLSSKYLHTFSDNILLHKDCSGKTLQQKLTSCFQVFLHL